MAQIWFGTKAYMQWVSCPSVDVSAGKQDYSAAVSFGNGGSWVRRSKAASKVYSMSWNIRNRADIQPILDYADGNYGNGYIYYLNPMSMDRNLFPQYWASPFVNYYDGPAIVDSIRPDLVNGNTPVNGYPVESAVYSLTSSSSAPSIFIPIPPGYTLHLGAHGSVQSGSALVTARPELSAISSGAVTNMTLLTRTTTTRTNLTYSGNTYMGVTISLASASTGRLQLDGMIAQCLPDGATVPPGGFIGGSGQSGLSFVSQPSVSEYSSALDRVGMSADLIETEAWAWG